MAYSEKIVISVGGSLIVPKKGIDTKFLSNLNRFIRNQLARSASVRPVRDSQGKQTQNKGSGQAPTRQFFLIAGGGSIARDYRDAGKEVVRHELTPDDLDWLGIHTTRLNAHLLRTIFRDIAHPFILKHFDIIRKPVEPVVVAAGWKPGASTDFDAVLICEDYNVRKIINLSNIEKVYDKDPKKHKDAKPIDKISWQDFRKLVGDKWIPGMNAPFDPVAAKKAEVLGIKVAVLSGHDFKNIENYLHGKDFVGTVIE